MILTGWVHAQQAGLAQVDLSKPLPAAGNQLFDRVDGALGDVLHPILNDHPLRYLYHSASMAAGGIAIGDVNGDGRPDIFISSGPYNNRLYRNDGNFTFEELGAIAGVASTNAWANGCAMADVDNDGDLDIYVCHYDHPNALYINDGTGHFKDQALARGLDFHDASLMPAFCDFDKDGDLDVYVVTVRYYWPTGRPENGIKSAHYEDGSWKVLEPFDKYFTLELGDPATPAEWDYKERARPDKFFRNNGDGTFTDATQDVGIPETNTFGNAAIWWDYDEDGWMDLYVSNDFQEHDFLYRNNGDGTFTESIREATPHTPWFSMGSATGDLNNDGHMDALIGDMAATTHYAAKVNMGSMGTFAHFLDTSEPRQFMRNALYLGTGTRRLLEAGELSGLAHTDWTWAIKLSDLNNDGRLDAYITNGMSRHFGNADVTPPSHRDLIGNTIWDMFIDQPKRTEKNLAYRNEGDLNFVPVSHAWGLDHLGVSFAAAAGDLDGDGDLDLVTANLDEADHLYRNGSIEGHRLVVSLRGVTVNRFGIGSKVEIQTSAGTQIRVLPPQQGFNFGLGDADRIQRLVVTWPGGKQQTYTDVPVDQHLTITEQGSTDADHGAPVRPWFTLSDSLKFAIHRDTLYDDFADQPLLPNKLSQLGPGVSFADINADGFPDVFLPGAAGQAGELHRNGGKGSFRWSSVRALGVHKQSEDLAGLFFDADGDGDDDLFCSTGSAEWDAGSDVYRNRLYLNNGQGSFEHAPEGTLPELLDSSGAAVAVDFDRDGDLDLFVGSRVKPKAYPLSSSSRLLVNEGGRFTDATERNAPGLLDAGLVSGACWSDADGDGWVDLLLAVDWGPIRFFKNVEGQLVERTSEAGLAERTGWWNGIASGDVDHDGDIDYLVTNLGLNNKYHPKEALPTVMFYGDFENDGKPQLVEATFKEGKLLPVRGRSCSSSAMPFIAKKFPTYHDFAMASLPEIYEAEKLDESVKVSVNDARSGLLINDGHAGFRFEPFSMAAQTSPGFGAVMTDVDADGHVDLAFVQNFYHPQRETPRYGGGLGVVMQGGGDGSFRVVTPKASGLSLPLDARGLAYGDINNDLRPDLVASVNNGPLQVFLNQGSSSAYQPVVIRLKGHAGNPHAIGARVTVEVNGLPPQTAEVQAGGGYLSQSVPELFFGAGPSKRIDRIVVRWPDGSESTFGEPMSVGLQVIELAQPTS
jgi:enediyne biosynthesis protein E4